MKIVKPAIILAFMVPLLLFCFNLRSFSVTYQVGPERYYKTLQEVSDLLNPGDVVEVDGDSTYPGDVIFERAGNENDKIYITGIRINGNRPIISGGTNVVTFATPWPYNTAEGGHHYVFEGFEITGGTSRGIFHQARDLTIRDCYVHDCTHGILGADEGSGSILIEYTEVAYCGDGSSKHQIYMATDEVNNPGSVFRMQHCYIHDASGGNNVKSRAERNEIYYNWVEGAYYHELELIGADYNACGGDQGLAREDSDVVGNVLIKKQTAAGNNPDFFVTRIGGDGTGESQGRYRFLNNTIICGTSAVFRIFDALESVEIQNNVFYNPDNTVLFKRTVEADWVAGYEVISGENNWVKTGTQEIPAGISGTITGDDPDFMDLAGGDLYPSETSALVNAGTLPTESLPGFEFPDPLPQPLYMPPNGSVEMPGTASERNISGAVDIGAYEIQSGVSESAVISLAEPSLKGIWVWSYDGSKSRGISMKGSSWEKILDNISASHMEAGDISDDGNLEIVSLFPGYGLWYYNILQAQWINITGDEAGCNTFTLAKASSESPVQVVASMQGTGIRRWIFGGIWSSVSSMYADLLSAGNIDRDENGIDELIVVFNGYDGLFLYDFNASGFSNIASVSASQAVADDITGDGYDEMAVEFENYGIYLVRYIPDKAEYFRDPGEKYPCFDIRNEFSKNSIWVSKNPDGKGLQFSRITCGWPDTGHDIGTGDISGTGGAEVIFTYMQRTYFYSYEAKGWSTLVIAPLKRIISGRFTGGDKDDIIACETSSGSVYLRITSASSWENIAAYGDADAMAVLK